MSHSIKLLTLILICAAFAAAQTIPEKKATEEKEKLEKEAITFLRETLADVNGMRSLENRISFTAEMAGLMWFYDEREARAMYAGVIGDFRDLLTRYDAQINALGVTPDDADGRGGFMSFAIEPTDKSRVLRRFATAMGVRQQIAMSIAEHDAELAFGFYTDSLSAISNAEFRKQAEGRDTYFEAQLLAQIAENNPAKAVQYAKGYLGKGITYQHVELLKKIHAKDADKGAEFAGAILSRLKTDKIDHSGFYVVENLMQFGEQTLNASKKAGGKRPAYTQAELRELAEVLAQAILNRGESASLSPSFIAMIQKYSPGRAAQIRAKFKSSNTVANYATANAMNAAVNSISSYGDAGYSNSSSNSNMARYEQQKREREEREISEKRLFEDVQSLSTKQLPKEEREKIIAQARKIIAQTTGRDKKVMSLGFLAGQVAKLGDKELAAEIMRDAAAFVSPAPKTYQDFLLSWILASGYAQADPDKAFPLLEETIGRANDTLAAFVKVGEFVDVAEEMIQDGEVQVGVFGGQMVRGLTRELGVADATIQVLAKADFGKTKNLTNRFERPEIRILAKMMVLRAVLNPKKASSPDEVIDSMLMPEPVEN